MFGRDPVLRISGRVIFELGGYGIATGVAGGAAVFVVDEENVGLEGAGVAADKFDVVAGTKNRFPQFYVIFKDSMLKFSMKH